MKRLTNLLAITLLTSCATAFAQEQEETTTGKSAVEQSADIYASGYNKFRFGGYGEILANFMDYGINRFRGTDNGSKKDHRNSISIPRFVLAFDYKFNSQWILGAEIEFEAGGTGSAYEIENTENGEYIQLDDIVLSSEGDGSNLETTLDQMMTTASVIEYVAQGTYWIGSGDETAMIFYFEDDQAYFDLLYNDNGQIQTQSISGIWSLDYDHLNLIDDETGVSYELGWDLSEEGDSYCFELTEDDTTYYLYESAAEDVDSTLDILTSYLTAEDSVDVESDDIDLSDFLEGYEGHSVIDAFMLSGISPDFETRKYCAELLGFVNYSGTSDENLALIQLMGGTVQ